MNACHSCLYTHNQDVREMGRCWCTCHVANQPTFKPRGTRSATTERNQP